MINRQCSATILAKKLMGRPMLTVLLQFTNCCGSSALSFRWPSSPPVQCWSVMGLPLVIALSQKYTVSVQNKAQHLMRGEHIFANHPTGFGSRRLNLHFSCAGPNFKKQRYNYNLILKRRKFRGRQSSMLVIWSSSIELIWLKFICPIVIIYSLFV